MMPTISDFFGRKIDYDFKIGIWDTGVYPPVLDFNYKRLSIHTDIAHDFLLEKTGKDIPLDKNIALTDEEYFKIHDLLNGEKKFIGMLADDYPKGYDHFKYYHENVFYPITNELETFDFKYEDL